MSRIAATFVRTGSEQRLALLPYLTAGFPTLDMAQRLAEAMLAGGADGLEIGLPFSDPLADGTTLQRASEQALRSGASTQAAFGLAEWLRARSHAPLILMSYYNPIFALGESEFCRRAADCGLDGLIVPDVPVEECEPLQDACAPVGLDYVQMAAPTSGDDRIQRIVAECSGFIYAVSLVGVTGARPSLPQALPEFLRRIRRASPLPRVVGFGISRPDHLRALASQAEGAVVASAIVDLIEATPRSNQAEAVAAFVAELRRATNRSPLTTSH